MKVLRIGKLRMSIMSRYCLAQLCERQCNYVHVYVHWQALNFLARTKDPCLGLPSCARVSRICSRGRRRIHTYDLVKRQDGNS